MIMVGFVQYNKKLVDNHSQSGSQLNAVRFGELVQLDQPSPGLSTVISSQIHKLHHLMKTLAITLRSVQYDN